MIPTLRVSLAHKCQLLFGAAVVLLLAAALWVVSTRMDDLAENAPRNRVRDLAGLWASGQLELPDHGAEPDTALDGVIMRVVDAADFEELAQDDAFFADAVDRFNHVTASGERFTKLQTADGRALFRYAKAVRKKPEKGEHGAPEVVRILLIDLDGSPWESDGMVNRLYLVAAGIFASLLAIAFFWYLTSRIFLQPVRMLRETTEQATDGDLSVRADIHTGDEFQELGTAFNRLVESIHQAQEKLKGANQSLDLKVGELSAANTALDDANKIKSQFLANVSHELRTPLNAIIGFAEVLEAGLPDDEANAKRRRYANNIVKASRSLLELINGLLDIAKVEAGRMDVMLTTFSPQDLLENLANLMRPHADKKNIRIDTLIEPNLPLVETDAGKLQQILFNFLSNAVKFSPEGSAVTLAAGLTFEQRGETQVHTLKISVTDCGAGIPPADQHRIFDKFTQLDPSVTRKHGGTGLGLHISRQLATLLGGQIELTSDLGQGATFSLILPLARMHGAKE